jgi:bacillolysin
MPLPVYGTADSAEIVFGTYNFLAGSGVLPHGNSVLYVDNLNFDNLITGISDVKEVNKISLYPNPTSDRFFIDANTTDKLSVDLYDINGRHVLNIIGTTDIDVSNLDNGVYTLTIKNNSAITNKKLVIAK